MVPPSAQAPKFELKMTGQAIATFLGDRTPQTVAQIFAWIISQKWKGCLEIHFVGNGGTNTIRFVESPKKLTSPEEGY